MTKAINIQRVWERSSQAKQSDFRAVQVINEQVAIWHIKAMAFLESLKAENKKEIETIWARPDAEEFAKDIAPKTSAKDLIELDQVTVEQTKISKYRQSAAERAAAKAEIAELAKGNKI